MGQAVLICGRNFTQQELDDIRETVRLFPKLSKHELANTICEHLSWVAPNGRYKVHACKQLLEKMEGNGTIRLPARKNITRIPKEIIPGSQTEAEHEIIGFVTDFEPIELELVRDRQEIRLWNEYVERYHVLGYKVPFGAHQRYFIVSQANPVRRLGCLLFAASAWALAVRDQWIGWTPTDRSKRLHLVVNNTRFLVFPWVHIKNMASRVLSLASRRLGTDWQERYGYRPVLLETFVDAARYRGTCYQAANWILLGKTVGRGRMDRLNQYPSTPKLIYVYPLASDFRACLCARHSTEEVGRA